MATPNPTTGVGVIAYVQATATPVALTAIGAGAGSTNHPVAQYAVTLSLANSATTTVTAVLKDVANTTESTGHANVAVFKAYCTQTVPAHPATTGTPDRVVTVDASTGLITARNIGHTIVEVQFPTFDNTEGTDSATGNPKDQVYAQIVVTVTA